MTSYTKGPWELRVDEDEGQFQINMGEARSCNSGYPVNHRIEVEYCLYPSDGEQWDEALATMKLIRAAPDLLAELEMLLNIVEGCGLATMPEVECRIAFARAAIAKASGESA